jgi:hypothetical protein
MSSAGIIPPEGEGRRVMGVGQEGKHIHSPLVVRIPFYSINDDLKFFVKQIASFNGFLSRIY